MQRFSDELHEISWRRNPISQPTHWNASASDILPSSQKPNDEVSFEPAVQYLRHDIHVGNKGGLEDDTDVGCIEEFDGILLFISSVFFMGKFQVDLESLHVNDEEENGDGGQQVGQIWTAGTVECLV